MMCRTSLSFFKMSSKAIKIMHMTKKLALKKTEFSHPKHSVSVDTDPSPNKSQPSNGQSLGTDTASVLSKSHWICH